MKIASIAPELRAPMRKIPPVSPAGRFGRWLFRRLGALRPAVQVDGVTIEQIDAGGVPVRLYRPAERRSNGALYWIHGGGYVIGHAAIDDRFCGETARALGIVVASVVYRLAPEHPFPLPLDDCHRGWCWFHAAAAGFGVDPDRIAIGGQSAGGGLAAGLVQRVHDEGPGAAVAQLLLCPMIDDRTAARCELDRLRHRIWSNSDNRAGWAAYLGTAPAKDVVPPYAVPARRTDLAGLPPAWIGVSEIDLFAQEDRDYADRLRATGVAVTFHTVTGAPHGFESWAPDTAIARGFVGAARAWLKERVG